MALGPVMVDLEGVRLTEEERELLQHPQVGSVILFSRNFENIAQLEALIAEIHALRSPRLLVCVDHEGGRVQRFREGFTHLPPARRFGLVYDHDRRRARHLAELAGWVMASELHAVGVDFSFAPVLDLDRGESTVIGDRAFHSDPDAVADLAEAYTRGMSKAGMAATGKHFPGHGGVAADSHVAIPEDERSYETIYHEDMLPFERLIHVGMAAVMPAHVIYSQVDEHPAGFSEFWLREVLRKRLGFQGIIFSDDLSMEGASVAGGFVERAQAALAAGCDVVLVCNNRVAAWEVVNELPPVSEPLRGSRLARMHARAFQTMERLHSNPAWQQAVAELAQLEDDATFHLVG